MNEEIPKAAIDAYLSDKPAGGIVIYSVEPGSPSANAGVRPNDRLLAVDGQAILSLEDYVKATANRGASMRVDILRGRQLLELTLQY